MVFGLSKEERIAIAGQRLEMKTSSARVTEMRNRFAQLHKSGTFVMPNAWDIGSARILASLGFAAIATTSSGFAASLGRMDQHLTIDEVADHARSLADAVDVPLSVDAERCYADDPGGVERTVKRLSDQSAAGVSIEDYDPASGIEPIDVATDRVKAAAHAAHLHGIVLTARAENHLYDIQDLDDTISRLQAYRRAGADVLYAPGLVDLKAIARIVHEVKAPINVLLLPKGPSVSQLAAVGVRRLSTGGSLAFAAYGALAAAARELLESGTSTYAALSAEDRRAAFES
jgi:2-methylisocitrate lyase-like PEP mutase family enzyme